GAGPQLSPGGCEIEARIDPRNAPLRDLDGRERLPFEPAACRARGAFPEAESGTGHPEKGATDCDPDDPIPQQHAVNRRAERVEFDRGPISGHVVEGAEAE